MRSMNWGRVAAVTLVLVLVMILAGCPFPTGDPDNTADNEEAVADDTNGDDTSGDDTNGNDTPQAGAPIIDPDGGTFTDSVEVSISASQENASLFYTLDGSAPNGESTPYESPFTLTTPGTTTVKAIATAAGYLDSEVAQATFTVVDGSGGGGNGGGGDDSSATLAEPTFTDGDGGALGSSTYLASVDVSGTTEEPIHDIYYTVDGSDPTFDPSTFDVVNGQQLGSSATIDRPTFKAIAVDPFNEEYSPIVTINLDIQLPTPVVQSEISFNTWAEVTEGNNAELPWVRDGLQVFASGMPAHISGESLYYYTLDGSTPVPGEAGTSATTSLTPFMPPATNPDNTLKVRVSYSDGPDTYIDSEVKTITYQREAAPVSWTQQEIDGSAFDLMAAELQLSSEIVDQGVSGASIEYRFSFQGEGDWRLYDDTRRPWLLPGTGPVVGLRSSAPGFLDWTDESAFGPRYYDGLVYLTNAGEVYLYQPGSSSDDILLAGFDFTPVEIATYGGSLYYIDSSGEGVRRWDPAAADPEFGGIDQNPAPGDGKITYISTDNASPYEAFYYMTVDDTGTTYRLWQRDVDDADADGDVIDDEIIASTSFNSDFSAVTSGLYLHLTAEGGSTSQWIHVSSGTLDVGGSIAYGSATEPDDWVDGSRTPTDVFRYDGNLHYVAGGSLYALVDGAGNDDAIPNVDGDGNIVSVDGS